MNCHFWRLRSTWKSQKTNPRVWAEKSYGENVPLGRDLWYCYLWLDIYIWSYPIPGKRPSKTLRISCEKRSGECLFYVNEVAFGNCLGYQRSGQFARGNSPMFGELELSVPLTPWWAEELEFESIANGQWFSQSRVCNEASIKSRRMGFREPPDWWTGKWKCWEDDAWRGYGKSKLLLI